MGGGVVQRFGVIAILALSVAGCVTASNAPPSPERPGTRVTLTNPNPQNWPRAQLHAQPRHGDPTFFVCKPPACAGAAMVAVQTSPSPTRNPDRTALEKAAKLLPTQAKAQDLMMEAASEGDERVTSLSSKVTELRGYPAIVAETKRTSRGKASFVMRGDLFIGRLLVKMVSQSTTRAEAKRNFDEFVAILEIIDFEAPAPGAVPAEPAVALDQPPEPPTSAPGAVTQ